MSNQLEVEVSHKCELGEGPVWDSVNSQLLWVDIIKGEIHQYSPSDKKHTVTEIGYQVSSIVFQATGGLIGTFENGFAKINLAEKSIIYLQKVEENLLSNRFNDGKCDPAGRFWAGTMDVSGKKDVGSLYVLETDFTVHRKIKGVSCSNGLSWSPDGATFYYIDTPSSQVVAYDYDKETGRLSNKRVAISIPIEDGLPDGMTVDTEGMLWIALWNGWKVVRYNPFNGILLHSVFLPVAQVTSCTFGGSTMEDLYITTAKTGLTMEDLEKQPLAGSLFVLKNSGYQGISAFRFNG